MAELPDVNVFEAIMNRRSCRRFSQQPIEWEKVCEVLTAGLHAPSSGNLQNWNFTVITEKERLHQLFHHTLEQDAFNSAQIGIIVCGDVDQAERFYGLRGKRLYTIQNCAACVQNMLLAAYALGLGATWIGAFDEEKIDAMFSIPGHMRAQAIILLGYPDEEPEPKERKEIDYMVYFNAWGEKVKSPHIMLRDFSKEWALWLSRAKMVKEELAQQAAQRLPSKEAVLEKGKNFFKDAQKKVDSAMQTLKDEEKLKQRGKK